LILDRAGSVHRLQKDNDNTKKESYVAYLPLANVAFNAQPASTEDILMVGPGNFGQIYSGFTTYSGVLEGDKLVDQNTGEVFYVKGRQNWMTPGLAPHIELLLTEFATAE
jgi:hypothetical protein